MDEVEVKPKLIQMVKCPWCGEKVSQEDYSDHLQEEHYKGEPDKRTGPYTEVK